MVFCHLISRTARFVRDDGGAITVDWVVLSAAVVGLALGAVTTILGDVSGIANMILGTWDTFTAP